MAETGLSRPDATSMPATNSETSDRPSNHAQGPESLRKSDSLDSDLDNLLDDDDDPALASLQKARFAELQAAAAATGQTAALPQATSTSTSTSISKGNGSMASSPYAQIQKFSNEKAAMHAIAAAPLAVLLFTHPNFVVCAEMEAHLSTIAVRCARNAQETAGEPNFDGVNGAGAGAGVVGGGGVGAGIGSGTRQNLAMARDEQDTVLFLSLEAETAPFLTERLGVRVLPCVFGYVRGEEVGRLVGFDGLGKGGRSRTKGWRRVIAVLRAWGILGNGRLIGEEDDDDDEDDGDDASDEDEQDDDVTRSGRDGGWIGGRRRNNNPAAGLRRNGRSNPRRDDDDNDDDWD